MQVIVREGDINLENVNCKRFLPAERPGFFQRSAGVIDRQRSQLCLMVTRYW